MKAENVLKTGAVETKLIEKKFSNELRPFLTKPLTAVVICSVVPDVLSAVVKIVKKKSGINPVVVGKNITVPIKNNYRIPSQVGQDRLVVAYAAKALYGAPAIVIDFGTAITFDVISRKGEYEGGMILPGIQLSAESLFQKTALLPRIDTIKPPKNLIGKNTQESILSGLFNGYGAMSAGLIDAIAKEIGGNPKVIVTGGYTHLMKKFISHKIHAIDPQLIFKGLARLSS